MFFKTNKKNLYSKIAIHHSYNSIVEQSRRPIFYKDWSVEDSIDGRFEILTLHMFIVLQRLKNSNEDNTDKFGQNLFDAMFQDMDRSLREQGVGDLGVPKHIKRMAKAFYGRVFSYENNEELAVSIRKNIYNDKEVSEEHIKSLVKYINKQLNAINEQSIGDLFTGAIFWAD